MHRLIPHLLALSTLTSALPTNHDRQDHSLATFQGLTQNDQDHSTRSIDPPEKYFHEADVHTFPPHPSSLLVSSSQSYFYHLYTHHANLYSSTPITTAASDHTPLA